MRVLKDGFKWETTVESNDSDEYDGVDCEAASGVGRGCGICT